MRKAIRTILPLIALTLAPNLVAQSQAPDLDKLQKQLDDAKAEEARAAEAAGRMATLVIRADAPCQLEIDGTPRTILKADQAQTLEVLGGEQLIECRSTEETQVRHSEVRDVPAGSKEVLLLELAAEVQTIHRAREREAAAAAQPAFQSRWTDLGNGVLKDSRTGLQWTQRDNGANINWQQAKRYCEGLELDGGDWRLPGLDELQTIFDMTKSVNAPCGPLSCKVSPMFRLTSPWMWSNTPARSSSAIGVILTNGQRFAPTVSYSGDLRALCVRRRS